jgi:hypothetical protein
MPLPGLLGLALIAFVCGTLAALVTGRRRSAFTGMVAAMIGGLAAPGVGQLLGYPVNNLWTLIGAIAASALVLTGLAALFPRR